MCLINEVENMSQKNVDYAEVMERWYQCDISRADLKELMQRSDAKGLVHTGAFFALLIGLGCLAYFSVGSWWALPELRGFSMAV